MRHTVSRATTTLIATVSLFSVAAAACSSNGAKSASTTSTASLATTPTAATTTTAATTATTTAVAPVTTPASVAVTQPVPLTTVAGGVDPNAPEVVEPGDIPDNQVFVAFASSDGIYSVKVPEGWARTETNGVVTFTDKYNSISVQSTTATAAPTVSSVTSTGLTDVTSDATFALTDVSPVTRKAGDGVLATFEIGSAPNPVTGKKALLAVERYVFFHNGTEVTLTLSGAKGADNVDPWKIVSDSLTWN
ncbi:MAG: hypothetical protein ABI862_08890 [Ilumatobacteraceae bacterium]